MTLAAIMVKRPVKKIDKPDRFETYLTFPSYFG